MEHAEGHRRRRRRVAGGDDVPRRAHASAEVPCSRTPQTNGIFQLNIQNSDKKAAVKEAIWV